MILTKVVWDMTLEKWSKRKPLVKCLIMFKCIAWLHVLDDKREKLHAKSHACIQMGYSKESKAYKLFDPIKQQIICKKDVVFDEKTSSITLLNSSSSLLSNDP